MPFFLSENKITQKRAREAHKAVFKCKSALAFDLKYSCTSLDIGGI
jgi:hypothetical protein